MLLPVLALSLFGCKGDRGPEGPSLSGSIQGTVVLFDEFGDRMQDNSGVTIVVEEAALSTTSASTGRWDIQSIPTGIYTLTFAKSAFSTRKLVSVQFVGGGTLYLNAVQLIELPHFTVPQIAASLVPGSTIVTIRGTVSSAHSDGRRIMILFSNIREISHDPVTYLNTWMISAMPDSINFNTSAPILDIDLIKPKLTAGKLYVIAYSLSGTGPLFNYHPLMQNLEITNLGSVPSNLDSVLVQ